MTRILSELLQASEPHFRMQLGQLERVNGHHNVDIKLSVEVVQSIKHKIHALGMDKHDTTGKELYQALQRRVSEDDSRLERALRTLAATYVSAEADVMAGMIHALQRETKGMKVMGAKASAVKRLLKKMPPKRLQKSLGYRSLDAMVRHEAPALIAAAAYHSESAAWRRSWFDSYKQLKPSDFENRSVQILLPADKRWQSVAEKIVTDQAHTVMSVPELGAVVILPLPAERPKGIVVATLALAFHELNALSAASTYLQASQVHGDFGVRVQAAATGKIQLEAAHMPQALPWQLVQRHFASTSASINEDIFGPYVQSVDFSWHDVESKLAEISPSLAFWQDTSHLTFLEAGKHVSLNLVDAATNACNQLSYEAQSVYHAQQSLWNELMLRYLDHASVEQAVASVLQPQLALETAKE